MGRLPKDAREELEVTKVYDPYFGTATSATHIVALEIEPGTYKVKIDRTSFAEDCGRVINPMIVNGQVHGGVAQGIGAALFEEIVYDERGQITDRKPRRLYCPDALRIPADRDRASRSNTHRRRWAAFAAWAKAARSVRWRPWPTPSRMPRPRLESRSRRCRSVRSDCSGSSNKQTQVDDGPAAERKSGTRDRRCARCRS